MKKTELVVKSNRLIEASYRLGLNEQRFILYAICRCREEQKGLFPDLPITITADSFLKQFPSVEKGSVYGQLKEAMNALYSRSVTIHDTDPATKKARVRETRWLSEKAYIDGAGHIQIVFTPEVIKYITRLEVEFTSYQLEKVGHMTSAHGVRIYEPAVDQINKHSDITVSYKPKKTGRAITDFVFKIRDKERKAKATGTASDQATREKLEALGQQRLDTETDEEF